MNIKEILEEVGRESGFSEERIADAREFADALCGHGKDAKAMLAREIPEDDANEIKAAIKMVVERCKVDPEYRKEFLTPYKQMELN